jgi:hypothetical protein
MRKIKIVVRTCLFNFLNRSHVEVALTAAVASHLVLVVIEAVVVVVTAVVAAPVVVVPSVAAAPAIVVVTVQAVYTAVRCRTVPKPHFFLFCLSIMWFYMIFEVPPSSGMCHRVVY